MNKENKEAIAQNSRSSMSLDGRRLAKLKAINADLLAACLSALRALEDNLSPGPMDEDAKAGLRAAIAKATAN